MVSGTGPEPAPIEVRPATSWEHLAVMLGPKHTDATVCWCLSYRALTKEQRELRGPERGALAREEIGRASCRERV